MASLTEQMQNLLRQKDILAEKIKLEEEIIKKQQFTLENLEKLNIDQKTSINNYKSKDGKLKGRYELQQANLMTLKRFEVILEILKKQEDRIASLEARLVK